MWHFSSQFRSETPQKLQNSHISTRPDPPNLPKSLTGPDSTRPDPWVDPTRVHPCTDQNDVGEVDDDYCGGDEEPTTWEDVVTQNDGQTEGDGASKTAVRHHKLTDPVQLRHPHQVRQVIQHDHH